MLLLDEMVEKLLRNAGPLTAHGLSRLTGEDKFRVLDVLRKLKKRGVCGSTAARPEGVNRPLTPVYDESFFIKGKS